MKNTVFITGGAGYVGTSLIPLLLENNFSVTVYDSLTFNNGNKLLPYISNPDFKFVKGDIRDIDLIKRYISQSEIVIHLAAYVGYWICREKGEIESYEVNTLATKKIVSSF